jgi:hypothetical protein
MALPLLRYGQVGRISLTHLFVSSEKLGAASYQAGPEGEVAYGQCADQPGDHWARVGSTRSRINYFLNKSRKLGLMVQRLARSKDELALLVAQGRDGCPIAVVVPISN